MQCAKAIWQALADRQLIAPQRTADIDIHLWSATIVRLWRDVNIEPGLTMTLDDWWAICEWLEFDPDQICEYVECPQGKVIRCGKTEESPLGVRNEIDLRLLEIYAALGKGKLTQIIQPLNDETADWDNTTAWENFLYSIDVKLKKERARPVVDLPLSESLSTMSNDNPGSPQIGTLPIVLELLKSMGFEVAVLSRRRSDLGDGHVLAWGGSGPEPSLLYVCGNEGSSLWSASAVRSVLGSLPGNRGGSDAEKREVILTTSNLTLEDDLLYSRLRFRLNRREFNELFDWIGRMAGIPQP
jgi:hypothetical protein